eukprot:TRINITY_DN665_c1_g1_i13.p1 TRINITY_DN665_c1_g1~~TRINITY_DN665_c1_g1_i13.p1  ORF type:complete len:457 (+),score=188.92 TRINITY_DN665_c1_g1_i13:139-1509(+)
MGKTRRGGKSRKRKTQNPLQTEGELDKSVPKCFVIHLGHVSQTVKQLLADLRTVMEPNTASKLKQKKKNRLKDFLAIASVFGVSHCMAISSTDTATYLKIARFPRGPTIHFRINKYSLIRDVQALQKNPISRLGVDFHHAPLVVLNNFGSGKDQPQHLKLASVMFQNMFPPINVKTIKLEQCRRVVLLQYDKVRNRVMFRHYVIRINPRGLSKGVKRLVQDKLPNLEGFKDIADYVLRASNASESDMEDNVDTKVELPDEYSGGKKGAVAKKASECSVRLTEIGPRMELEIVKIENGLFEGDIIYHQYVKKSKEESEVQKKRKQKERDLKQARKNEQKRNVEAKKSKLEEKRQKRKERREQRMKEQALKEGKEWESDDEDDGDDDEEDSDLEVEYDEEYEKSNAFDVEAGTGDDEEDEEEGGKKRKQLDDEEEDDDEQELGKKKGKKGSKKKKRRT